MQSADEQLQTVLRNWREQLPAHEYDLLTEYLTSVQLPTETVGQVIEQVLAITYKAAGLSESAVALIDTVMGILIYGLDADAPKRKYYHVSPASRIPSIKKLGLLPGGDGYVHLAFDAKHASAIVGMMVFDEPLALWSMVLDEPVDVYSAMENKQFTISKFQTPGAIYHYLAGCCMHRGRIAPELLTLENTNIPPPSLSEEQKKRARQVRGSGMVNYQGSAQ